MLVAAQLPSSTLDGPKIISGIRKRDIISPTPNIRPKLSGELLVRCGHENSWWPRKVTVRGGQLIVASRRSDDSLPTLRLPLRQLSLQAGPLVNSLSLTKGPIIVLTIQTSCEKHFDLWVKAIAIELIRQTPLFAIKYLDILTLTDTLKDKEQLQDCPSNSQERNGIESSSSSSISNNSKESRLTEEKTVENILKKCQNVENYVPVKEKLVLFESLCRLGRKVRSSEDVSYKSGDVVAASVGSKRARSMHDLSSFGSSHVAVREICKYFENKRGDSETFQRQMSPNVGVGKNNKRLVCSDSQLHHVDSAKIKTTVYR